MKKIITIISIITLISSCASKKASCEAYGQLNTGKSIKNNITK